MSAQNTLVELPFYEKGGDGELPVLVCFTYVVGKSVNLHLQGGVIFIHLCHVCDHLFAFTAEGNAEQYDVGVLIDHGA